MVSTQNEDHVKKNPASIFTPTCYDNTTSNTLISLYNSNIYTNCSFLIFLKKNCRLLIIISPALSLVHIWSIRDLLFLKLEIDLEYAAKYLFYTLDSLISNLEMKCGPNGLRSKLNHTNTMFFHF